MADPKAKTGKIDDELEHLIVPESKEILKRQKDKSMSKGHRI